MPKILINEIDDTKPGAPSDYSNYSVLLTGFVGDGDRTTVRPDSNGVYEFKSAQDFLDTIGPVPPTVKVAIVELENGELAASSGNVQATNTVAEYEVTNYGNQMAYELLNQGYSIVYLPIEPSTCAKTLTNENTWETFKDKANYDFRFISHGLLESSTKAGYSTDDDELINLQEAFEKLKEVIETVGDDDLKTLNETDQIDEVINKIKQNGEGENNAFESNFSGLLELLNAGELTIPGLREPGTGEYYSSLEAAVRGVLGRLQTRRERDELVQELITAGKISTGVINTVNTCIANLAKYVVADAEQGEIPGRGDCIALIELDENCYVDSSDRPEIAITSAIEEMSGINEANGKYCAMTVPSIVYKMSSDMDEKYENNKKFPGAFHYLACFKNSLQSGFAEWYAAAGYTRGVSSYTVDYTTVRLGEVAINALEPRNKGTGSLKFACNVIANFRGSYYLWGNRTAHPLGDANSSKNDLVASHFLNIRHLCTTIKKQLYVACRRFTFDPNSDSLWFNFVNTIKPTLERMKADQGIRDYKILKVVEERPQKAMFKAKIRIIPIEAVEDFELTVYLEDSFGDTVVSATESV